MSAPSERAMECAREYFKQPLAELDRCLSGDSPFDKVWAKQSTPEVEKAVNALASIIDRSLAVEREEQRERASEIAEIVNDSIRQVGKFRSAILNPNTCLVPLSGGGHAVQPEHVFDGFGCCVYCATIRNQKEQQ